MGRLILSVLHASGSGLARDSGVIDAVRSRVGGRPRLAASATFTSPRCCWRLPVGTTARPGEADASRSPLTQSGTCARRTARYELEVGTIHFDCGEVSGSVTWERWLSNVGAAEFSLSQPRLSNSRKAIRKQGDRKCAGISPNKD